MSCDLPAVRRAYEEHRELQRTQYEVLAHGRLESIFGDFDAQQKLNKKMHVPAPPLLGKSEVRKSPLL